MMNRLGAHARRWLALASAVSALWAGAQPLFSPAKEVTGLPERAVAADVPLRPRQESVDVRVARSDLGLLDNTRAALESGQPTRLSLNLSAAAAFDVTFERSERTLSGYALSGRVVGEPLSGVTIAVGEGRAYGSAWTPEASYVIEQLGPSASIRRVQRSALDRCEGVLQAPAGAPVLESGATGGTAAPASGAGAEPAGDDGSIIDVIVFYTPNARRQAGGHRAMRTLIDHHAAWTNDAYAVGGAVQRIRVVAVAQVADEEEDHYTDLTRLETRDDGHMEGVHALRDAYAADLVLLMNSGSGGLASRLMEEEWSFAIAGIYRANTFAHELGHLMGLAHQRQNNNSNWPFPYSHGYELRDESGWPIIATIMHNSGWTGLFSNPRQTYRGHRLGVPGDEPTPSVDGPADAIRSLDGTRRVVANFRRSATRCAYAVSPAVAAVPAAGGEFSFRVEADVGCAWAARSADAGVSIMAGSGPGPGEVTYRVSPHEGWPRELAVFAAGEMHLVEQSGTRELSSGPCERSPAVRGAVSAALGKPCEDVHAADLAGLGALDLGHAPARLAPGDFDGLANLGTLRLNPAEGALTPGVFHGLPRLQSLAMSSRGHAEGAATRLVPGVFGGLSRLETLSVRSTPLASVAPGAFDGLPRLASLTLEFTELKALEAGIFDGLPALRYLNLELNRLAALPTGTFDGLSELESLSLACNRFEAFEPGVFRGLVSLVSLNLDKQDHFASELHPDLFLGLRSLEGLRLGSMGLTGFHPDLFRGLAGLRGLSLYSDRVTIDGVVACGNNRNRLALQAGAFRGLSGLWGLGLDEAGLRSVAPGAFAGLDLLIGLTMENNALVALDPGVLGDLNLRTLFLNGNALRTLPEDLTAGAELLYSLRLHGNRLESLPPNAFVGLGSNGGFWTQLTLHGNPGAPFDIEVQLVQLPASPGRVAQVALRVREGAPIDMAITLTASGGSLSAASIGQGEVQGPAVSVASAGNAPMVVALGDPPAIPGDPECGARVESKRQRLNTFDVCHTGYRLVAGAPLTLYGFADQTLSPSGATVRLSLANVFLPLFASGGLAYEVELDGPAATARVEGGELVLVPAAARGEARVTVTVTDGREMATRSFVVRVGEPPANAAPLAAIALEAGGEPFEAPVAQAFSAPTGATLTFSAISSAPELATARVVGGTLTVVPNDAGREGRLTIAVTATDELGLSATQHVEVTVSSSSRPFLRGWRLTLPRGN